MIKKTITYTDYDGNERTEDFYFNLTQTEILELEVSDNAGMEKTIQRIIDEKDMKRLVAIFKDVIMKSYGKKSVDGRRFEKSKELLDDFMQTEAFSQLFIELATNADKASEFINGVVPTVK